MELKGVCDKCRPLFETILKRIEELERRLALYENAHTPPSQKRFPERKQSTGGKIGAPKGSPTKPQNPIESYINIKVSNKVAATRMTQWSLRQSQAMSLGVSDAAYNHQKSQIEHGKSFHNFILSLKKWGLNF